MASSTDIALSLLQVKAVKLNPREPFTWASGMLSPIYCDNRIALSHPALRKQIKQEMAEASKSFEPFEVVAGVATAGIPHGALLADLLEKPFIYVRSAAKDHGRRNQIEGELHRDQQVLVIEDLISTGGSSLLAVEAITAAGGDVSGVLAIFQYGFPKATAAFAEKNIRFQSLTDYPTLLQVALETGYITVQDHELLRSWSQSPEKWGALYAN
jgi:orotate phosphoribosyltransferase